MLERTHVIVRRDYLHRLHWRLRARLPMWVIYFPVTREYPGVWVARMHITLPSPRPTRFVMTHDSYDELCAILPPDVTLIPRHPDDVPEIAAVAL